MDPAEIGPRLKALRKERQYSLQDVAEATGLSRSFLSYVENGASDISIGRLVRLVKFYGVTISRLLNEESHEPVVVRKGEERSVPSHDEGLTIYFLTPDSDRKMMPLRVTMDAGGASREPVSHEGEEFVHVIDGSISVLVGDDTVVLKEGDSVYFRGESPHAYRNLTPRLATYILVVTPPSL